MVARVDDMDLKLNHWDSDMVKVAARAVAATLDPISRARCPYMEYEIVQVFIHANYGHLAGWWAMNGPEMHDKVTNETGADDLEAWHYIAAAMYAHALCGAPLTMKNVTATALLAVAETRKGQS